MTGWRARLAGAWERFWFAPAPVRGLVIYRIALSAWTATFFLPRLRYLSELYDGAPTHHALPVWGLVGGAPVLPVPVVLGLVLALLAALGAFAAGVRARLAHGVILALLLYLYGFDTTTIHGYATLSLVQWALLWCAPYDLPVSASAPRWGLRLLQLQFASVYFFTVPAKLLDGTGWRNGSALYIALRGPEYGQFLLSRLVSVTPGQACVLGWATLAAEAFIALGLWWARTRRLAMFTCCALHLGIALSMRVSWLFAGVMLIHLPLFASWKPRAALSVADNCNCELSI